MKRHLCYFAAFISLLLFNSIMAQNEKVITINVKAGNLPEASKVYIVGSHALLGEWNPGRVPLEKNRDGIWTKRLSFKKGETLEFKFTLGSWDNEALNEDGSVPGNYNLTVTSDTTLSFGIRNWKKGPTGRIVHGQITGSVKYHTGMTWQSLDPRDVIVWLPPSYAKDNNRRYPVLYMHDGQNIIDPNTSSFGYDWQVDETSDSLIKAGRMQEVIIVGINNTKDRTAEYSYTELGRSYMRFIVEKLKPMIDSTYRTLPDRENTATMGSSMGGLISFMLIWEHPEVFSKAACLSPAFKIQELDYLPFIEAYTGPRKPLKIYIDNGGIGLEKRLLPGVEETVSLLKKKGYSEGRDLMFYYDKNAEHNEPAWAKRLYIPLEFLFGTDQGKLSDRQ
ncbi:MAG: histidine kinase [Ignavibacteria bacterium]|jgi:predicted alpha/beta superfamily hydrolase|nr:histidine kinase [Ignavibacteria bacterium]MCU7504492.1 histidine kinase [Ignavibacteria bacterium]MCU7517929.1 histidine kinase [Ignavibacteria bacterium]